MEIEENKTCRIGWAIIWSSLIPAVVFGCFAPEWIFFVCALIVTSLHTLFLGLPVYAFLKKRDLIRWWSCMSGGLIAGMLPIFLLMISLSGHSLSDDDNLIIVLIAGGLGAVGGLAGWVSLSWAKFFPVKAD